MTKNTNHMVKKAEKQNKTKKHAKNEWFLRPDIDIKCHLTIIVIISK